MSRWGMQKNRAPIVQQNGDALKLAHLTVGDEFSNQEVAFAAIVGDLAGDLEFSAGFSDAGGIPDRSSQLNVGEDFHRRVAKRVVPDEASFVATAFSRAQANETINNSCAFARLGGAGDGGVVAFVFVGCAGGRGFDGLGPPGQIVKQPADQLIGAHGA